MRLLQGSWKTGTTWSCRESSSHSLTRALAVALGYPSEDMRSGQWNFYLRMVTESVDCSADVQLGEWMENVTVNIGDRALS